MYTYIYLKENIKIWSENFLFYHKLVSQRKRKFYLFYYNGIFKDRVLFK